MKQSPAVIAQRGLGITLRPLEEMRVKPLVYHAHLGFLKLFPLITPLCRRNCHKTLDYIGI